MLRLTLAAAGIAIAGPALAACEIDRPVTFADLNYGSAQFHTAVASYIIEHGYACEVDAIPGDTIPLINGVARGDADIIMEIWMSNPAPAWLEAEAAGQTVALGTTFPDSVQGWFVPTAVLQGDGAVAPGLKTAADLAEYKDLFTDPEEPEKGRFYNCPAGWVCEEVNSKKLMAYGLDDDFTNFRPGTGEALLAAVEAAALRDEPVVFYYWGPSWILGKYDFTLLQEEPFDKEVWDAMLEAEEPTEAVAYPAGEVIIGANTEFASEAPALAEFLSDYASNNAQTSEALAFMRDNDAEPVDAAMEFLKTQDAVWTEWVPEDVADKVRSALDAS